MKTKEPREPGVSWWRFFATIIFGILALFLFHFTHFENAAILPIIGIAIAYNNKTRLIRTTLAIIITLMAVNIWNDL